MVIVKVLRGIAGEIGWLLEFPDVKKAFISIEGGDAANQSKQGNKSIEPSGAE